MNLLAQVATKSAHKGYAPLRPGLRMGSGCTLLWRWMAAIACLVSDGKSGEAYGAACEAKLNAPQHYA